MALRNQGGALRCTSDSRMAMIVAYVALRMMTSFVQVAASMAAGIISIFAGFWFFEGIFVMLEDANNVGSLVLENPINEDYIQWALWVGCLVNTLLAVSMYK